MNGQARSRCLRILFCSSAGLGHVAPMIPLALALRQRGHAVAWATAAEAFAPLRALRLSTLEAGASAADCRNEYLERWPEARTLRGTELAAHTFPRLFGGVIAPRMLTDLILAIGSWQPDLVINETGALAAPLACRLTGVRHVTHGYGLPVPDDRLALAAQAFAPSWDEAGLEVPEAAGLYEHLYIDICPPGLQARGATSANRVQRLRPSAGHVLPGQRLPPELLQALAAARRRPVIYLTFGTIQNRSPAFRAAATALAEMDATLVVTTGPGSVGDRIAPLRSNLHVFSYLPQPLILRRCDLVVSHAGAGTMLGTLAHGLPQLALPQAADQFRNAAACTAAGAGLTLEQSPLDAEALRATAASLLASTGFRVAARAIAADVALLPAPDEVACMLERFGRGDASRQAPLLHASLMG